MQANEDALRGLMIDGLDGDAAAHVPTVDQIPGNLQSNARVIIDHENPQRCVSASGTRNRGEIHTSRKLRMFKNMASKEL